MRDKDRHFYHTTAWERCRAAFMASKHYTCERCKKPAVIVHHKTYITDENETDESITLNWDNLEALCIECHNKEHKTTNSPINEGLFFDENGQLQKRG